MKISPRSFKPGHRGQPGVLSPTPHPPPAASFRRCGGQRSGPGWAERARRLRGVPLRLPPPGPGVVPPAAASPASGGARSAGATGHRGAPGCAEPEPPVLTRMLTGLAGSLRALPAGVAALCPPVPGAQEGAARLPPPATVCPLSAPPLPPACCGALPSSGPPWRDPGGGGSRFPELQRAGSGGCKKP